MPSVTNIIVFSMFFIGFNSAAFSQNQSDDRIDYYILPVAQLRLSDEIGEALERTERLFNTHLMENGTFRERADPETLMEIGQCTGEYASPIAVRQCELELATSMSVDWVFEFDIDDFDNRDYFVSVTLWDPEAFVSEYTFGFETNASSPLNAAREILPEIASRIASTFSAPTYIRLASLSPSNAQFTIDGENAQLPSLGGLIQMNLGDHEIAFEADGYESWSSEISFQAGDIWVLNVLLESDPVEVTFRCNEDAEIEIDGTLIGTCRAGRSNSFQISPNRNRFRAFASGYQSVEETLNLVSNHPTSFDVTLRVQSQDNDRDGIPNDRDMCPDFAETVNSYQDQDGCPDVYNRRNGPRYVPPSTSCGGDDECAQGADCVSPGFCQSNLGSEIMTYADINASAYFSSPGGECVRTSDCGPWVCERRVCVPPEQAGRAMPLRQDIRYFDGSCLRQTDCGSWTCSRSGWCRDPNMGDD